MSRPFNRETGEPIQPLGWQHVPGGDWEVYEKSSREGQEHGGRWVAYLYDEDVLTAKATARTKFGLARKMRRATRGETWQP